MVIMKAANCPKYSIRFTGTIDRKYHKGYCDPMQGRFTFFKRPIWTTPDFQYVKELASSYNIAAHRNSREADNMYMIVQISEVEGRTDCHWEREIEIILPSTNKE